MAQNFRNSNLLKVVLMTFFLVFTVWPTERLHAQPEPTIAELNTLFVALELTPAEGMRLLVQGFTRAAPLVLHGSAALQAHLQGASAYFLNVLHNNPVYLRSTIVWLSWAIETGLITPATANKLGHGSLYSRRGGSVSLEALIRIAATAMIAHAAFTEGREFTSVFLMELEQATSLKERNAYTDLLAVLLDRTINGNVELCDGMNFGEAATRLRINLQTAPTTPYWGIACAKSATMVTLHPCASDQPSDATIYVWRTTGLGSHYWQNGDLFCGTYYNDYAKISGDRLAYFTCTSAEFDDCTEAEAQYLIDPEEREGINRMNGLAYENANLRNQEISSSGWVWQRCRPSLDGASQC